MGRAGGGRQLRGLLDQLEEQLLNYYGAINEISMGLNVKVPEKPAILAYVEQFEYMKIPFVSGGLFDQPFILMEMVHKCIEVRLLQEAVKQAQQ